MFYLIVYMPQQQHDMWRLPQQQPGGAAPGYAALARHFIQKSRSTLLQWANNTAFIPRKVKELMDQLTTHVPIEELQNTVRFGYFSPKVVYLFTHHTEQGPRRQYVGSAWNGIADRAARHFRSASLLAALPSADHRERKKGVCAYGMYRYWAQFGLSDMLIIPLQVAPATCSKRHLLCLEQFWMDSLGTLDFGYNHKRAVAGEYGLLRRNLLHRTYGSRDMQRRIGALSDQLDKGYLTRENAHVKLQEFSGRTLIKVFSCLKDVQLGRFELQNGVTEDSITALTSILEYVLDLRRHHARAKGSSPIMVCVWHNLLFDKISFKRALVEASRVLPAHLPAFPLVAFKYSHPIGKYLLNASKVGKHSTEEALLCHLPCKCHEDAYRAFVPVGHDHIISGDSAFFDVLLPQFDLEGITAAEVMEFKRLWEYGAKFRFLPGNGVLDGEVRALVLDSIQAGLLKYKEGYVRRYPDAQPCMGQYVTAFMHSINEQMARCPDGTSLSLMDIRHTTAPPDLTLDKLLCIRNVIHKFFIVTVADKVPNNYTLVCKPYYCTVTSQVKQQEHYTLVQGGPQAAFAATLQGLRDMGAEALVGPEVLAYAVLLPKLHKPQISFRVLTACKGIQLSTVGTWLTCILRALLPGSYRIWQAEVKRGNLQGVGSDTPWFILRSAEVIAKLVHPINQARISAVDFWARGGPQGFDWTDMYTNLPMDDLAELVVTEALRPIWHLHDKDEQHPHPVLKVYSHKHDSPVWYPDLATAVERNKPTLEDGLDEQGAINGDVAKGKDQVGEYLLVTLAQVEAMYIFLLQNSYIKVFAEVFRQVSGIPIGISPGVYIATLVAFVYELRFLRQLVDIIVAVGPDPFNDFMGPLYLSQFNSQAALLPDWQEDAALEAYKGNAARYVWSCFKYTVRFVDDLEFVANPLAKRLLHQSQSLARGLIKGLYPDSTPIKEQQHLVPSFFPYLDTLQIYKEDVHGHIRVETHLYDKRRESCYDSIQVVQYTPPLAGLSDSCLYNIFVGQLFRYQRIITDQDNFEHEVALLIHKLVVLGYQEGKLLSRLKYHLKKHAYVFPAVKRQQLLADIVGRFLLM